MENKMKTKTHLSLRKKIDNISTNECGESKSPKGFGTIFVLKDQNSESSSKHSYFCTSCSFICFARTVLSSIRKFYMRIKNDR